MKWNDYTPGELNHLATLVKLYKDENEEYPKNLTNIIGIEKLDSGEFTRLLLLDHGNHKRYQLSISTNGFYLSATLPSGLLNPSETMTKFFSAQ
jgi:hypothetical protein